MNRCFRAVIMAGLFATSVATAQGAPDLSHAPAVASAYLEAVRARGFAAEADFLHPDELERLRGMLQTVLEADQAGGGRTLLNATFGRDASIQDARDADSADFVRRFARVMAVRMPEQPVGFDELQVVGTVEENPMVHVLVRLRSVWEGNAVEELRVVTLLPYENGWKLKAGGDLDEAVRSLDTSAHGKAKRPPPRLVPSIVPSPPPRQSTSPTTLAPR